jgi:hypothetical protein
VKTEPKATHNKSAMAAPKKRTEYFRRYQAHRRAEAARLGGCALATMLAGYNQRLAPVGEPRCASSAVQWASLAGRGARCIARGENRETVRESAEKPVGDGARRCWRPQPIGLHGEREHDPNRLDEAARFSSSAVARELVDLLEWIEGTDGCHPPDVLGMTVFPLTIPRARSSRRNVAIETTRIPSTSKRSTKSLSSRSRSNVTTYSASHDAPSR